MLASLDDNMGNHQKWVVMKQRNEDNEQQLFKKWEWDKNKAKWEKEIDWWKEEKKL